MPAPVGRPTLYSEEMGNKICERLALGESLVDICLDKEIPCLSTVYRWLSLFPDFSDRYARARLVQADVLFDQIIKIADTPVLGVKTITKPTGVEYTEGDMIEHRRLRVDARKWVAAKLAPKKYGDKIETTLRGDANHPIAIENVTARELVQSRIADLATRLSQEEEQDG
jgi:hypothetical protein